MDYCECDLLTDVLSPRLSTSSRDPDQPNYSNVKLPPIQPLADIDADTVARLIILIPILYILSVL